MGFCGYAVPRICEYVDMVLICGYADRWIHLAPIRAVMGYLAS